MPYLSHILLVTIVRDERESGVRFAYGFAYSLRRATGTRVFCRRDLSWNLSLGLGLGGMTVRCRTAIPCSGQHTCIRASC